MRLLNTAEIETVSGASLSDFMEAMPSQASGFAGAALGAKLVNNTFRDSNNLNVIFTLLSAGALLGWHVGCGIHEWHYALARANRSFISQN